MSAGERTTSLVLAYQVKTSHQRAWKEEVKEESSMVVFRHACVSQLRGERSPYGDNMAERVPPSTATQEQLVSNIASIGG